MGEGREGCVSAKAASAHPAAMHKATAPLPPPKTSTEPGSPHLSGGSIGATTARWYSRTSGVGGVPPALRCASVSVGLSSLSASGEAAPASSAMPAARAVGVGEGFGSAAGWWGRGWGGQRDHSEAHKLRCTGCSFNAQAATLPTNQPINQPTASSPDSSLIFIAAAAAASAAAASASSCAAFALPCTLLRYWLHAGLRGSHTVSSVPPLSSASSRSSWWW